MVYVPRDAEFVMMLHWWSVNKKHNKLGTMLLVMTNNPEVEKFCNFFFFFCFFFLQHARYPILILLSGETFHFLELCQYSGLIRQSGQSTVNRDSLRSKNLRQKGLILVLNQPFTP